jgi:cytochrome oxidase Cu insertion factor (SCO1/SenC/PrrC family)
MLIILTFAAPMLIAHLALRFQDKIKQHTSEYGHLVLPAHPIKLSNFESLVSNETTNNKSSWQLVYVAPIKCDNKCLQRKQELLKLHALLREDSSRVQLLSINNSKLAPFKNTGEILLIDPQGTYIMYYDTNAEPSVILKDLMRLLKYSNV